jgi:hypothetical protein
MDDPSSAHLRRERLASILLRSQLTDAEYQHLKECSDCVETIQLLLNDSDESVSGNSVTT